MKYNIMTIEIRPSFSIGKNKLIQAMPWLSETDKYTNNTRHKCSNFCLKNVAIPTRKTTPAVTATSEQQLI